MLYDRLMCVQAARRRSTRRMTTSLRATRRSTFSRSLILRLCCRHHIDLIGSSFASHSSTHSRTVTPGGRRHHAVLPCRQALPTVDDPPDRHPTEDTCRSEIGIRVLVLLGTCTCTCSSDGGNKMNTHSFVSN